MNRMLEVRSLTVHYGLPDERVTRALSGVSLEVAAGEVVGVLGESGCGKTTLALSILRLLPPSAHIASGFIGFLGRDLLQLSEEEMEHVRGREASLIFQEPGIALNPVLRVGSQVADVLRVHQSWPWVRCRKEARSLFECVGLGEEDRIYSSFPHQLSGGQRQRVVIAMAIACGPALVIADEPTASLDATVQAEILYLFKELRTRLRLSTLWISHHPAVVAQIADRVLVMYAGQIVEEGALRDVFRNPLHPYTKALLQAQPPAPKEAVARTKQPFRVLAEEPLRTGRFSSGCAFEAHCLDRMEICRTLQPEEARPESSRRVRCFKYGA